MSGILMLNKSNCKNCYKCIRHCPVKAIRFSGNQAHIIDEQCILCGECYVVCPQHARVVSNECEKVSVLLAGEAPVYASVAPSFAAAFPECGFPAVAKALRDLGFADAEETARGATLVKKEYEVLLRRAKGEVIISSCCHAVNLLIEKHYPTLLENLAPVVTPLQAHTDDIKRRHPDAKVVFIGPCIAKKDEAEDSHVDAVLTFDDLEQMFAGHGITPDPVQDHESTGRARLFPTTGGILKSMDLPDCGYSYLAVDGPENCRATLEDVAAGGMKNVFIEMSACVGSCSGGPIMRHRQASPVRSSVAVTSSAGASDYDIAMPDETLITKHRAYMGYTQMMPGENEIKEILKKMGKNTPADELNCGTCGYNTCREKAIAVYNGKADISMCLPFLTERAESFSSNILNNTPNGILVVNEDMEVQQINRAAMKMLRITSAKDVLGELLVRILDPLPFVDVLEYGKRVDGRREYLAEYNRYIEETIVHDKTSHNLLAILRDVTDEEEARQKKEEMEQQTVAIADKVVEKQMRIVQEIASLLGETAAETKIALTKLKETITHDDQTE